MTTSGAPNLRAEWVLFSWDKVEGTYDGKRCGENQGQVSQIFLKESERKYDETWTLIIRCGLRSGTKPLFYPEKIKLCHVCAYHVRVSRFQFLWPHAAEHIVLIGLALKWEYSSFFLTIFCRTQMNDILNDAYFILFLLNFAILHTFISPNNQPKSLINPFFSSRNFASASFLRHPVSTEQALQSFHLKSFFVRLFSYLKYFLFI